MKMDALKGKNSLITILIAIIVLSETAQILFPMVLSGFSGLANVSGFAFGGLFETGGLGEILLSVGLLVVALGYLGIKSAQNKR